MTNRKLIIQHNTSYPIVDTPKTLFLVRLVWLLNKPLAINALTDPFKLGDMPPVITEEPLPDTIAIEQLATMQGLTELPETLAIEEQAQGMAVEALTP